MRKGEEEALSLVILGGEGQFGEQLRSGVEPGEAEVGRQRVAMSHHVAVFQVPGILVGHPLVVSKYAADLTDLSINGGFVAAQLLKTHDVCVGQLYWSVFL